MPARRSVAAASVVRTTEATGSSPRGWEAAVAAAVKASAVEEPVGVEVARLWAEWRRGKLGPFHATVKVAYRQRLRSAPRR